MVDAHPSRITIVTSDEVDCYAAASCRDLHRVSAELPLLIAGIDSSRDPFEVGVSLYHVAGHTPVMHATWPTAYGKTELIMNQRFGMLGLLAAMGLACMPAAAASRASRSAPAVPTDRGGSTYVAAAEPLGRRATRRARGRARAARADNP